MIILDTNVLSEALKPAPAPAVMSWLAAQEPSGVFITAITQAEILYGIELLPAGKRRNRLAAAVEPLFNDQFEGRIFAFDEDAARLFPKIVTGRTALGRPISHFDAMIVAIARSRSATVATSNIDDFEHCGLRLVNPWSSSRS